jgi:hypothetical protein
MHWRGLGGSRNFTVISVVPGMSLHESKEASQTIPKKILSASWVNSGNTAVLIHETAYLLFIA